MNKQFAISIIHPTARVAPPYPSFPTGWLESCEQFLWKADHPEDIEYVLSVHESNWKVFSETWTGVTGPGQWSGSYCPAVDGWGSFKLVKSTKRNCVIDNGQAACEAATGLIFMGSMDDLFPPKHWDTLLKIQRIRDSRRKLHGLTSCMCGQAPTWTTWFISRKSSRRHSSTRKAMRSIRPTKRACLPTTNSRT